MKIASVLFGVNDGPMDLPPPILAIAADIARLEYRRPNHLDGCDRSGGVDVCCVEARVWGLEHRNERRETI